MVQPGFPHPNRKPFHDLTSAGEGVGLFSLLAAVLAVLATPAAARDLLVGPGQPYDRPSAAVREAKPGDRVLIDPGEYYDCAAWTTPGLTLQGSAPGAVLTDSTCAGKAILVVGGPGATLRNLTLARARVGDGNGAGVRLEAPGLVLDAVTFTNDQAGLLSGVSGGTVLVKDCMFVGGGGASQPGWAIQLGAVDQLLVRGSTFEGGKGGAISSGAADTTLTGNVFTSQGTLPAVLATGPATLSDNRFDLAADAEGRPAAVMAVGPSAPVLRNNRLHAARPSALLLDWSHGSPVLDGNEVGPADSEVSTSGSWRHRASVAAHGMTDGLRGAAGRAKRWVTGR